MSAGDPPRPSRAPTDERQALAEMLDVQRRLVVAKIGDVAAATARATPLPSASSMAGIVYHLASVEDGWLVETMAGKARPEPWTAADETDPDWEFHRGAALPLDQVIAQYRRSWDRADAAVADLGLDHRATLPNGEPCTLRWALLHLIEETAHHLGHLDVLHEILVADDPTTPAEPRPGPGS